MDDDDMTVFEAARPIQSHPRPLQRLGERDIVFSDMRRYIPGVPKSPSYLSFLHHSLILPTISDVRINEPL